MGIPAHLPDLLPLERQVQPRAEGAGIRSARVHREQGCAHARPV